MIFGSNLLDFAIGLVLIFFVLSLFCSFVNERIASTINLRAKTLEDGIEGLVPELAAEILNSPLIRGLSNQHGKNGANAGSWVRGSVHKATSYIDSRTFSTALIHEVLAKAATISPPPTPAAAGASQPVLDLKTLRDAAALLQDDHTRGALLALIDAAQGDFDRAQRGIEKWFDDAMERLSGWYKRRTQLFMFFIGLGAAVVLNADTLAIANDLWRNDAHRQAAVAEAVKIVQSAGQTAPATTATPAAGATPAAAGGTSAFNTAVADLCVPPATATPTATGTAAASTPVPTQSLKCVYDTVQSLHVPLGYTNTDARTGRQVSWFSWSDWWSLNFGTGGWGWIAKALGFLITALAISQGAPFWFDLLTRLGNLRNTGAPPAPATGPPSGSSGNTKSSP